MKVQNVILAVILAVFAMAFTSKNLEYTVDKNQTKVEWVGKKVTGEHNGYVNVANGNLSTKGNQITGGIIEIDMASITCEDIKDEKSNQNLVGHLKSDDFFSTAKHPKATLVVGKVTPKGKNQYQVKGDLTIKGIKHPVEFPATITHDGTKLNALANITIDRTKYDIRYGSGSFFDNLGDKAIDNNFVLNINLVANAQASL
jgi:polyisoprenoid-binding protein YceI